MSSRKVAAQSAVLAICLLAGGCSSDPSPDTVRLVADSVAQNGFVFGGTALADSDSIAFHLTIRSTLTRHVRLGMSYCPVGLEVWTPGGEIQWAERERMPCPDIAPVRLVRPREVVRLSHRTLVGRPDRGGRPYPTEITEYLLRIEVDPDPVALIFRPDLREPASTVDGRP